MHVFRCECGKSFENKAGLSSHKNWCDGSGLKSNKESELSCEYCGKSEFNSIQGLGAHVRWCEEGPERDKSKLFDISDERRRKINRRINKDEEKIRKTKKSLKKNWKKRLENGYELPEKTKKKISKALTANPDAGGYRKGGGRSKGCWHDSPIAGEVWLDSSYELAYAKRLDENNIKWERNTERFSYTYNGEKKKYIPDFYLVDENKYIEIKGFEIEKDRAKWSDFPHELEVLKKKDLLKMGCDL